MRFCFSFGLLALAVGFAGCSAADPVARIAGSPTTGATVTARTVVEGTDIGTIGVGQGAVVAGVGDHLVRSKLLGDDALVPVALTSGAGEPTTVGTTAIIARRSTGYLALSDHGLFHDAPDGVVVSPLSAFFTGKHVRSLDAFGSGNGEALFFVTDEGGFVRRGTSVVPLALNGTKIEALVAIDDRHALAWAGGTLAEVDVAAGSALTVLTDAPPIAASDRGDDGVVWLATSQGLFARATTGSLSQRTFVAEGESPRAVRAVAAGIDRVVALVGPDVVSVVDGKAEVLVSGHADANRVAVDANGDVWIAAPKKLERLALGKPSSFAVDVAPFMKKHCQTCHTTGVGGAPIRAFDDFDVARTAATEIALRLRAAGRPVMPPPETERLAPSDVRIVLRWIASGTPH